VAERDGGRQGDRVAAEEGQFHARQALSNAVAHGRNAARDLGRGPDLAGEQFHLLGVAAIGRMRRQHVVIGGDDADIGRTRCADRRLVLHLRRGEAVSEIAAGHAGASHSRLALPLHRSEISAAGGPGSFDDPVGDGGDVRVKSHDRVQWRVASQVGSRGSICYSCQVTPSRSVRAIAADGPHVPAP
jgi:hypothetical protein